MDQDNDDWNIFSLHSTIEFLKSEISVKNDVIKTLINRCSHCKHDTLRVNSDDTNVSVNNNSANDILDCNQQFSANVTMVRDKNVIDDRYVASMAFSTT